MKKNELKYKETKQIGKNTFIDVEIGLRYIKENGYSYFYAVGDVYELKRARKKIISSGCIHEEILKYFPEFKTFVQLHGNSSYGMPIHMFSNIKFAIDNNKIDVICSYLGISDVMAKELICWGEEIDYIKYFLEENDIIYHLRSKANKAIKMLEELTGNEFENPDVLGIYDYEPLNNDTKEKIKKMHENGYFTMDNVIKRRDEKIKDLNLKFLEKEKMKLEKEKREIDNEIKVLEYLFDEGISLNNHAYLRSVNVLAINLFKNRENAMSEEDYKRFLDSVDYSKLPNDITFEFHKI
jgi:hypothetical protein